MSKSKFRQSVEKSYWGKKILAAKKRGTFTFTEQNDAAGWPTCACGKLDPDIPRNSIDKSPCDSQLYNLGAKFSIQVDNSKFDSAMDTLEAIQRRAGIVLADVEKYRMALRAAKKLQNKLDPDRQILANEFEIDEIMDDPGYL